MLSPPECGQSGINSSKIDDFQVLVWVRFRVSFWRCFGSPNGGQSLEKSTSKNLKKMIPKMSPNWSQRGSQNGAKIVKNEVLEASCFKGGSQEASRPPPGSILERFWDHFGIIFVSFSNIFLMILACILQQYVTNKHVQNHKESSKECSRELPRNNFSLRATLHWKVHWRTLMSFPVLASTGWDRTDVCCWARTDVCCWDRTDVFCWDKTDVY